MSWIAVGVLVLGLVPAIAAAEPIVVRGHPYDSWADYYASRNSDTPLIRCGTPAPLAGLEQRTPHGALESLLGKPSDCSLASTTPAAEYEPTLYWEVEVVVHRLQSITGMGNFPDAMVQSQIDVLNEDYQAIAGSLGAPGKNVRVVFKLATRDPDGNPSPGWTRTTNDFWFNDLPDPLNGTYYDRLAWDPHRYLNIYTLSPEAPGGVILGYVPFLPQQGGVGTNEDGVRCLWNAFGRNSSNPPYDLGRTVTHEVGHWLGLYHTFEGGCGQGTAPQCYTTGDRICDTEPDETSHGGCPTDANTCGDPDPIRNYMEYTDDLCMNNFTHEQARRMRCTIEHYRPSVYQVSLASVTPAARAGQSMALRIDPNPLRSSGRVSFRLERAGHASLAIVDVAGRVVRTLAAQRFGTGEHRVEWDGKDSQGGPVSAGAYFARVTTGEGVAAQRIVMIR